MVDELVHVETTSGKAVDALWLQFISAMLYNVWKRTEG